MNNNPLETLVPTHKIATLVDHERDGRYIIAFCPICDHAEEAKDDGAGRDQTQFDSIAKIKLHIRHRHRTKSAKVKITVIHREPSAN
jgi:hypothetical protein